MSRAWRILTNVHFASCRYLDATEAAEQMIEHARLAGDRPMELRALPALVTCAQLGPMRVPEAIAIAERVLAAAGRRPEVGGVHAACAGQPGGDARSLRRGAFAVSTQPGDARRAGLALRCRAHLGGRLGTVELIAGDAAAAESELRHDHEALAAMGERNYISTTAAFLAEALYRQGRDDEALRMTQESEEIAAEDDVATQYLWRSVRAKLLARRGDFGDAEAMASEAIEIIEAAQDPDSQGYAWLDLAEVLRMAGRWTDAMAAADEAEARFDQKGNEPSAGRARALRKEIEAARDR